jgi:hypothetical protein
VSIETVTRAVYLLLYTVIILVTLLHIIRSIRFVVFQLLLLSSSASKTPGRAVTTERVAKSIGCLCTAGDRAGGVGREPSTSLGLTKSL